IRKKTLSCQFFPQEGRRVGCASSVLAFHGAFQGLRVLTGISLDARLGAAENKGEHWSLLHHQRDCDTANSKGNKRLQSLKKKQAKTSFCAQAQRSSIPRKTLRQSQNL
uniref:Uncharacterized protein n=1 Tax=Pan troglodytes TaxID=9598 RepID=A0A2I3RK35_PANTR